MRALSASSARRHSSFRKRLERGLDRGELVGLERGQPAREPGRAACADALEQLRPVGGEDEPDAAAVVGRAHALEQLRALEPVDVAGECRRRDPLLGGELAQAEAGALLDQPEQRHLAARDAEGLVLLAQLAREAEQHRTEAVGEDGGVGANVTNH